MKKFYKQDWFLKVISVLVSVILWIYVVYFQNPDHEKWIRNIPVVRSNVSSDFENGRLNIIESTGETINIKVKGSRKAIAQLNNQNVKVTADLFGISKEGTYTLSTGVVFPVDGIEILQKQPYDYEIHVDKVVTVEKKIDAEYKGSLKEGFSISGTAKTPEYIKLTGPESYVNNVDKALVTIDLANASEDIKGSYKVKLFNGDKEIENLKFTKNIEYADVHIKVVEEKEVDVVINAKNVKDGITLGAEKVKIKGKPSVLANITSVQTENFDASNLKDGEKINIGLMPIDDVEFVDNKKIEIMVTATKPEQ